MGRGSSQLTQRDIQERDRKNQAWWGIAGLILVVSFIAISYVLSKPVGDRTYYLVPGVDRNTWGLFVGFALFVLLLAISGILFSLFAPKRKEMFSERELDKDRKFIQAEAQAKKDRQKQMRQQIAKARREGK